MASVTSPISPGPRARDGKVGERVLAVSGCAVATLAMVVGTGVAAFLTPYRIGTVLVPISIVITALVNVAAVRFASAISRRKWPILGPGLAWLVVVVWAAFPTSEADLIIPGNWVGLGVMLIGASALTVAIAGVVLNDQSHSGAQ